MAQTRNLELSARDSPMCNRTSEVRVFDAPRNDRVCYPISRSTASTALRSSAVSAACGAMGSPTS
jgi:hypothetical protein